MNIKAFLSSFIPQESTTPWTEKLLSALLIVISLIIIVYFSQIAKIYDETNSVSILASIGASAILVFAVPHGKLSQPWPVIGSHMIAATVGISCAKFIPELVIAAGVSVSLSALIMYLLRCLHPPGGGTALGVVYASSETIEIGYNFVFNPVLVDCLLLVGLGLLLNNIVPNRSYPYALKPSNKKNLDDYRLTQADISQALEKMGIYVDVTKAELSHIYAIARDIAEHRRFNTLKCQDVMSQPVISVEYGDDIETIWALLSENKIRALPVVDNRSRLLGMVTITDILKQVAPESHQGMGDKFRKFIKKTDGIYTDKLEYAGHLMSKNIITVNQNESLDVVIETIEQSNKRHIPVLDDNQCLVGMITAKNVLKALKYGKEDQI